MGSVMLPFVINVAGLASSAHPSCNSLTAEEPLPSILASSGEGYLLSHATRMTAVQAETTDDN